MMKKTTAIVIGYGRRGSSYAKYSLDHPDELQIVSVAEPEESRRIFAKELHNIPDDMVFDSWQKVTCLPRIANFAIISTQDRFHLEPTLECINKGYNILLEKPMSSSAKECKMIAEAAEKKGVKVIVCHVLRFTNFWRTLKEIIDRDEIGEIVSVVHMENVGHLHHAHSFTRGNWRNSKESSSMILQKCCHDFDILQWLVGKNYKKVQSFGSLTHFKKENQPKGAPDRCTDGCPYMDTCYYNPVKFYVDDKVNYWRDVAADKVNATDEEIMEALKTGPYGRCVYACDNDVVDHQVVNMEFEGGCTVSFTMNSFNEGGRFIRLFGTKGEITASGNSISVYYFDTLKTKNYDLEKIGETIASGHGGGDTGIVIDALKYFNDETPSKSISTIRTSYMNHLVAFAAEESRLTNTIIDLESFSYSI